MFYRFGEYTLNTETKELHRAGVLISLERKVFQVLTYLVQHRNRLVTKQELLDTLWPAEFVTESSLTRCIVQARKVLGDHRQAPQYIKTVHGQGYRFVAAVTEHSALPSEAIAPTPSLPLPSAEESPPEPAAVIPPPALSPQEHEESRAEPAVPLTLAIHSISETGALFQPIPVGEYKSITVLSGALAHTAVLIEHLGIEGLQRVLQTLSTAVHTIGERYEGTVYLWTNDHFILLFGAPVAQEDHAYRAVLAALALQHQLREEWSDHLPFLQLCQGIASGVMIVRHQEQAEVGSAPLSATVLGETKTIATQLQYLAEPGTILLSAMTARLVQKVIQVEEGGSLPGGKGSRPIRTYRVVGVRPADARPGGARKRSRTKFVGREGELALLYQRLEQVWQGYGQVVIVRGEPGIGKSRLLAEFRHGVKYQEVTFLEGHCQSYNQATPYLPILELVRQFWEITPGDDPAWIRQKVQRGLQEVGIAPEEGALYLLPLFGVVDHPDRLATLSPQALRKRTFETLQQLFFRQSRYRPVLLVVENVHWIDATSAEWLSMLVERLVGVPLFLLVTTRLGYQCPWMHKSYVTQIALQPLTPPESQRVVQDVLGSTRLATPLVQRILVKAEGNPFFLEELTRTVLEQEDPSEALPIPETIQAVLAARIDRLPLEAKRLLQVAAVMRGMVSFSLLQAVTALPADMLQHTLTQLQAAEFLYETQHESDYSYIFKHILTQEVAYHSLLQHTRRQYHQRIAEVLAAQFPERGDMQPELLAHHYTEAGLSAQAIIYWQRAGQRALERSAYVEAISHLTRGLDLLRTLPETPERNQQELALQTALGPAFIAMKSWASPEVQQVYTRARELCPQVENSPQLFRVLGGLRSFYQVRADLPAARELGIQLLTLAQHHTDAALLPEAHRGVGMPLFYLGEFVLAREHFEQGITFYDAQQHRSQAVLYGQDPGVICLVCASWVLGLLGYLDQSLQRSREALALAHELSHPFSLAYTLGFTAILHQRRRAIQPVQELAEVMIALATEQEFTTWVATGWMLQGWALTAQGRAEEGLTQLERGLTTYQATGAALGRPEYMAWLAESYAKLGQPEKGLDLLAEALALVHKNQERYFEAELYRLQGEFLLAQKGARGKGEKGKGVSRLTHHTSRITSHAETVSEAEACFQQALDIARHQQAKAWELRTAISLSKLWQQQGKREAARQLLAEIYGWFTEGFDTLDLQEAKGLLEAFSFPSSAST